MSKEFEIARILLINAARAADIPQERGVAWAKRVYPLIPDQADEAFKDDFDVEESEVARVLQEIDAGAQSGQLITYRTLESRVGINIICRCAFLEQRFDPPVWQALMADAPLEARSITEPFDPDKDMTL